MADSEESNLGDYPLTDIPHPHPHDVLCGRGGGSNNWIGNSHWRMLVAANKQLYVTLPKRQKMLLSRSIVHAVRSQDPPGRFLQKDSKSDKWYDIGDQRAQEKTSQALREGAPELRTKLKDDKPKSKSSGGSKAGSGPTPESRSDEGANSPMPPSDSSVSGSVHAPSNPPSRATSGSVAGAPQLSQQTSAASIGQVLPPAAVGTSNVASNAQPMAPSSMPPPAMRPTAATASSVNQQQQQQQQDQQQQRQQQQRQQQQQQHFQQQHQQQQHMAMMYPQYQNGMPQMMQGQHPQQMMNGAMFYPGPNMPPMPMYPTMMYNQQGMMVPVMSMMPPNMQMGANNMDPNSMQQQEQQRNNNLNNNNNSNNSSSNQQQQQQQKMNPGKLNGVNDNSGNSRQQKLPNQNSSQQRQQQQQQQGNMSHFDQKLEGLPLPPDGGLEGGGFSLGSIGSITMTENEMKRLETAGNSFGTAMSFGNNQNNNNNMSHAHQQHHQQQFFQQQYLQQQQQWMEQYHRQQQQLAMQQHQVQQGLPNFGRSNDDFRAVPPPDGGLEPQGLSFGSTSLMSIGDAKLEATGISFGSAMSFRMTPDMVEGGLDNIGMSFGSMTLATNNEETFDPQQNPHSIVPPPPTGPNAAKSTDTMPTLFHQNRSNMNLLDCSDTDSDDEEQSAQRSHHKRLEWEKMKSLVNANAADGSEPLPLPPNQSFPSSFAMPSATTFRRDFSQMSQLSVGDGDHDDPNLNSLMAAAAMPPPPPKMQQDGDGEWQGAELLILKSQQSGQSSNFGGGRR